MGVVWQLAPGLRGDLPWELRWGPRECSCRREVSAAFASLLGLGGVAGVGLLGFGNVFKE